MIMSDSSTPHYITVCHSIVCGIVKHLIMFGNHYVLSFLPLITKHHRQVAFTRSCCAILAYSVYIFRSVIDSHSTEVKTPNTLLLHVQTTNNSL